MSLRPIWLSLLPLSCALALLLTPATIARAQSSLISSAPVPRTTAPPHILASGFFGTNIENSYFSPPLVWTDPQIVRTIKRVGIQTVRFPGGDAGNNWDWQQGTMYPRGGAQRTQDTVAELAGLTRATGTNPVYNLNVMTLNNTLVNNTNLPAAIDNQMELLAEARAQHIAVKSLELGNEFFWSGSDYQHIFPTSSAYATAMQKWTARLKEQDPHVQIAAVGSIPTSGDARTRSWNAGVIGKIHGVDAITLHRYDNIIDTGMWDNVTPDAALSFVFSDWAKIQSSSVRPIESSHLRIWITEFGGIKDCTTNARLTGTWLEALYQAQMVVQFLSEPSIDQIELYNVLGSTSSLMFQDTSSYWDTCLNKNITFNAAHGELTATGQADAIFGSALRQARAVAPIALPEAPTLHPQAPGTAYPSATGVMLEGANRQWILLNLGPKPLTLHYAGMGEGTIESLWGPSLTTKVTSERVLTHTTHNFDGRNFQLPPYSVNRIVVR